MKRSPKLVVEIHPQPVLLVHGIPRATASCPSSRLAGSRSRTRGEEATDGTANILVVDAGLVLAQGQLQEGSRESGSPGTTLNWATPPSSTRECPVLMLTSMLPLGWVTVRISIFSESWRMASSR